MALAILELIALEGRNARFEIDTGTNKYYQFRIGKSVRRLHGIDWIDEITGRTPLAINESGGDLLRSSKEVAVPIAHFPRGADYVQLFSFKTPDRKSPAFSRVVKVRGALGDAGAIDLSPAFSIVRSMNIARSMNVDTPFLPPRSIPCRSCTDRFAQQASLEDLLSGVVKIAGPAVMDLLLGAAKDAAHAPQNTGTAAAPTAESTGILKQVLNAIVASLPGLGTAISGQKSLVERADSGNRFLRTNGAHLSRPFILPALIPLLPALVGPLLQSLPQLMNAANQKRLQLKQEDNKLISDILGGINRRLLMDQVLQAQKQTPASPQNSNQPDLAALLQLLQQLPAAEGQPAAAPPPDTATTHSLPTEPQQVVMLSNRAILSFVTAEAATWNDAKKVLFTKDQPMQLKVRVDVAPPAPATTLAKALLRIVFKDAGTQALLCETTSKQSNVRPGAVLVVPIGPQDVARLPLNRPIVALGELRWPSKTGKAIKALGSLELVIVKKYSVKDRGKALALEKELTDLKRFKPFWNKIWESPPLDAAGGRGRGKKLLWEINANAKYSVLLSADQPANGLMEPKFLRNPPDESSVSDRTEGRMKAGIELSIVEINKLLSAWDGVAALDAEKLEAFKTEAFAKNGSGEFVHSFRMKGRAGENAMIWVAPIFNLFEFTVSSVQRTDDCGQIVAMGEEQVRFPLPVAARVLGLKSQK